MKCEKCKTDTDAGEWYQFYYGTLLASWTSYQRRYVDALERVTSKKYRIEGSEKVFFCYRCMSEEKAKAHWKTGGAIIKNQAPPPNNSLLQMEEGASCSDAPAVRSYLLFIISSMGVTSLFAIRCFP